MKKFEERLEERLQDSEFVEAWKEYNVKLKNGNTLVRNADGIWVEILESGIEIIMDEEIAIETLVNEVI